MGKIPSQINETDIDENKSLLNRNFILTTLAAFIFFFNFHAFILLPIRIEELGGGASTIGFIMGITGVSTIFTTPAVGVVIDRFGKRNFLAVGGLLMSLTTLPFAFLGTLNFLYPLLRFVQGAAFSLCFISAGTLVVDVSPISKRAQALGLFGVFTIINYALAPFAGKLIVESYSFRIFFILVFMFGFLSFLVSLFIREPRRLSHTGIEQGSFLRTIFRRGVFIAVLATMIAGSGFIATVTFIPVFSKGINVESFHFFFISYTLSALGIRLFGGWIPDRFGRKKAIIPSLFFFSLSILWLGYASNDGDFTKIGILFGLSHGLLYPSFYALVLDLTPVNDRGKAFSICSVAFTLGGMLGLFIYGLVAEYYGFHFMFKMIAMVCLLGFAVFSLFARESRRLSM